MNIRIASLLASGLGLLAAAPAVAQTDTHVSLGVTAGSLGVGPELGVRIGDHVGVRGSASFLGLTHDVDVNDIDYHGKLKLESYGVMADLYPFGGGFRLSAGLRIDHNKVRIDATPTSNVTIGDLTFTPSEIGTLTGTIRAKDSAPVATLGYAAGLTRGIKLGIDAGAMFQGKPQIDDLTSTGTLASNATYQAELAKEQQRIDDKVSKYKVYPVVQVSLLYSF